MGGVWRLLISAVAAGLLVAAIVSLLLLPQPAADGTTTWNWFTTGLLVTAAASCIALAGALVFVPSAVDARLLRAGPLRRAVRWWRQLWWRLAMLISAWPHMIDVLLGTRRTRVAATPSDVVWRNGRATLVRYRSDGEETGEPVLLVHALVTRPWILDLTPSRSLVRHLQRAGHPVFLLDWGDPGAADASLDLRHCAQLLVKAEAAAREHSGVTGLHLVGYCLAGTVCLIRLASAPSTGVVSAALIAPPVDFGVASGFRRLLGSRWLRPVLTLDHRGLVPTAAVREAFHVLRPQALRTVSRRLLRRPRGEEKEFYAALARWIWEQRPLPGRLYFELVDLYREGGLRSTQLAWSGQAVDLSTISIPILVATADRDHIVPRPSSHALTETMGPTVELLSCPRGHVSMMVGASAITHLWPGVQRWLARNSADRRDHSGQPDPT